MADRRDRLGAGAHGGDGDFAGVDQVDHRVELGDVVFDQQQILRTSAAVTQQRIEGLRQRFFGYRLREVRYRAEVERALPLLGAGDYVHRNVGGRGVVLEFLEQAPTVGIRQTDVERDRIRTESPRERESLRSRKRDDAFEAAIAREPEQNPREHEIVLDDQQDAIGRLDALAVVVDLAMRMLFGNRARYGTNDSLLHAAGSLPTVR